MGIGFGYGLSISIEKAWVNASAHVFMLAPASGVMTKYSLLPFRWQFGDHWAWAPSIPIPIPIPCQANMSSRALPHSFVGPCSLMVSDGCLITPSSTFAVLPEARGPYFG